MHLQKVRKEKHWKNESILHLELFILQDSTSTLRIFNNVLFITALFLNLFPIPSLFYVTSIPLITVLILRICPSFCLISVGSTNFSLLDNGLCLKRRSKRRNIKVLIFHVIYLFISVLLRSYGITVFPY